MLLPGGETLQEAVVRYHAAPDRVRFHQLLTHLLAACQTVAYAHTRSVFHGHLDPTNILIGRFGETLVIGWGENNHLEQTNGHGLPAYLAPERALPHPRPLNAAVDVYGIGACLYKLLTGQPPFSGSSPTQILYQVRAGSWTPPQRIKAWISPPLAAVCQKALALQPEQRYSTAQELAEELQRWLAQEPVHAYRPPFRSRLAEWGRRLWVVWVAACLLLLFGLVSVATAAVVLQTRNQELFQTANQDRASRANAIAARDQLEERALLSRELADRYFQLITDDPDLKEKPEFQRLRKGLMEIARPYYQRIAEGRADDVVQEIEQGRAWGRLARIHELTGDKEAARQAWEQMQSIHGGLIGISPRRRTFRQELATSYQHLGLLLIESGDRQGAERAMAQAVTIREQLTEDPQAPFQVRQELAATLLCYADVLLEMGDSAGARQALERTLLFRQSLVMDFPMKPQYRRELAACHFHLGQVAHRAGDHRAAVRSWKLAAFLQDELILDFPDDPTYRQDLAATRQRIEQENSSSSPR